MCPWSSLSILPLLSVGPVSDTYLFNEPGTGISATVGNLTIFESPYSLEISSSGPFDEVRLYPEGNPFAPGGMEFVSSDFEAVVVNGTATALPDYSLSTFINSVSQFGGSGFPSVITAPDDS
jgi:hypothetical protein